MAWGGNDTATGGGSLRMWKDYFPNGEIAGIDLHDKQFVDQPRIRTFQGDQSDPKFQQSVIASFGTPDIVIDDGSHRSQDIIASFEKLFPLLAADGIYAIEDLQTSYWPEYGGGHGERTAMEYFKSLIDGLNHAEYLDSGYQPGYFDRHIVEMHFYHNLIVIQKGTNDERSNIVGP